MNPTSRSAICRQILSTLLLTVLLSACTDDDPGHIPELVSESVDPTTVDPDATRIVGFVRDYETAEPIAAALVSTQPDTETRASRSDGSYVLSESLLAGQLYTVEAVATGYVAAAVPVLPRDRRETRADLLLIDADRALPIELDPPVVAMPPNIQRAEVSMRSRDEAALQWRVTEQPDWLVVEPAQGELEALGTAELAFSLEPEAFAQARRGIASGESLLAPVELRDQRDRIAVVQVLVVPAADADIELTLDVETTTGDASLAVLGRFVDLDIEARYQSVALEGAEVELVVEGPDGGLVVRGEPGLRTDDDGELELRLDAQATGEYTVRVSLPGWPEVAARQHTLTVVADDACAIDNGGCGARQFVQCVVDEVSGAVSCQDIDECQADDDGTNGCGVAQFWTCVDQDAAPPQCTDIDECATDNGGCGDATFVGCVDNEGAAPTCTDIDECAANNGGCGNPTFVACTNNDAAPPTCTDLDECAVDASGNNGCGVAVHWDCTDNTGAAPTCVDVDECAVDADGVNACGEAAFWTCTNNEGAAPTCVDIEECATANGGCNATWQTCVEGLGEPPTCVDRNECAVDNGGCGDPQWWQCVNNMFAPPTCEDIDECTPDASGLNVCGLATRWDCTNNIEAAPTCADTDECVVDASGNNACGVAQYWDCTNRVGLAPVCTDIDECATNNGGCPPDVSVCVNNTNAPAQCQDRNECATSNGGCDPLWETCVDNVFAPPTCIDIDECTPDASGNNLCGEAAWLTCVNNLAAPPTCTDIDACEVANDANGCGAPARGWSCVDAPFAAPTCAACAAGTSNLDNDAGNGCEYICSPATEQCNQTDDDCDGLVDEGFDLASNNAHCGACNVSCGSLSHTVDTTCSGGRCQVLACEAGWRDVNGDPIDGCEIDPGGNLLYVDAIAGSATGPGTAVAPFDTLQGALGAAVPNDTIIVRAGVYAEHVTVSVPDVVIQGEDRDTTVISSPDNLSAAVRVTADRVTVNNLTILGGRFGVWFDGAPGAELTGGTAYALFVTGQKPPRPSDCAGAALSASGIQADDINGLRVHDVSVFDVVGGSAGHACCNGCGAPGGSIGAGIRVTRASACRIEGNAVSTVRGGGGGNGGGCSGPSGAGGASDGIRVQESVGCVVRANTIANVDGGKAGRPGGCGGRQAAGGGVGTGIFALDGSAHTLEDNIVDDIKGGDGGNSTGDYDGGNATVGIGIYIDGANLTTALRNEVATVVGGDGGDPGNASRQPGIRGNAVGIYVHSAASVDVTGAAVWRMLPGEGAGDGLTTCVQVNAANPVAVEHLSCHESGTGTAAVGYGVRVVGASNAVTVRNSIISTTNTACIQNDDTLSAVTVGYDALWACGDADIVNAGIDGFIYADPPRFALSPPGNLHLLPVSSMIDAAEPGAPFSLEPAPNGCAANLGAYGNTTEATAAPGATHCN